MKSIAAAALAATALIALANPALRPPADHAAKRREHVLLLRRPALVRPVGGANNLLIVDQTVGGDPGAAGAHAKRQRRDQRAAAQLLSNIVNENGVPATIKLLASDTDFIGPVSAINNSGSLTFNSNVGAPLSTLSFWADPLNTQGANPTNTPGTLLESVSGSAATDPDSFSGSLITPFSALGPYSMTEGASLSLRGLGSITGFNQSMESTSPIPEPSTWAMLIIGFGFMAWGSLPHGIKRVRSLFA